MMKKMKTPFLDEMIEDLRNHIEHVEAISYSGIPETRKQLTELETIKAKLKNNGDLGCVSMIYRFQVGNNVFEIESNSEKEAMLILVNDYWGWINRDKKVELLGEREK